MSSLIDPHSQAKTLMIMRHAEADMPWGTSDFDRPLTANGHADAPRVGRWMVENGVVPEMIITSSALRTRQTCTWICDELADKAPTASLEDRLYNAPTQELLAAIGRTPDTVRSLLVIAHYPAVQDAVLSLASRDSDYEAMMGVSSNFPPAGLAVLSSQKPWAALDGADAILRTFIER
ncbi:histidine phosphatase family protein [Kocuria sp. TGY1127_2]|uniref:SixA phosphatase family protein n=1 Tax=Kocuria sp. TGY1127_2 TaxID=2711328 RepID=UPI0015B81B26|nr:histidine phosphatase family protein [Kocuria sp. TGY1127_2]